MRTVSAALSTVPSLTINCSTYVPAASATNVGLTADGFESSAPLPDGLDTIDHVNVSAFPSASLERDPSRRTVVASATVWSGPAFAVGGRFGVTPPQLFATWPSLYCS